VEEENSESRETAMHLAKQFFTSTENSIVRLFHFKSLHKTFASDITYRLLNIREERVNHGHGTTGCRYRTIARDFLKKLQFSKTKNQAIIILENSNESSIISSLVLSNISETEFLIYRVIKDYNSSVYKDDKYKVAKDIHINKWSTLFLTGFRRFPEICTGE
jgi:hypothetical protein